MVDRLAWKPVARMTKAAGMRRAAKEPIGTASTRALGSKKQLLWVKVREDSWRGFVVTSVNAGVELFRRKPGAGAAMPDRSIAEVLAAGVSTAMIAAAPVKKQRPLTARLSPDELWRRLEERGARVVRRHVAAKEVAAAERTLKITFPPSYVELVTEHGAPAIGKHAKAPAEDLAYAVLTPKEIVRHTRELRRVEPEMFLHEESTARVRAQLANAAWFQFGRDAGEGWVFLLDTADRRGEMCVADFHHDWIEELDWARTSRAVCRSLAEATFRTASRLAEELPGSQDARR